VTDVPPPARPKRGYLGPGVIALVALVGLALLINYVALSNTPPHTLSGADAATLVSQGLQASRGRPSRLRSRARSPSPSATG
jgi:hypothetical protein